MNKMACVSIIIIFFLAMFNKNSNKNRTDNNLFIISTETNELEIIDFDISTVDLLDFNQANLFVS